MSVKASIGNRIATARTALNLSQLELAKLTGFGKTRISNWETGFRTPKLEESKILEKHLQVPAPYLLCLNDHARHDQTNSFHTIPLFEENELLADPSITTHQNASKNHLPLMAQHCSLIEQHAFGFELIDQSMAPEFEKTDLIIFLPNTKPRHNQHVLVSLRGSHEVLFRKYFLDNSNRDAPVLKLIPYSGDWVTHHIENENDLIIYGVMSTRQRLFI